MERNCLPFLEHASSHSGFKLINVFFFNSLTLSVPRRVWRYQIRIRISKDRQHNDNENRQKDKQRSTQKTEDRATRNPLKTGGKLRCSGRVGSFKLAYYTSASHLPFLSEVFEHILSRLVPVTHHRFYELTSILMMILIVYYITSYIYANILLVKYIPVIVIVLVFFKLPVANELKCMTPVSYA